MKIIIPMAGLGTRFAKVADQNPEYRKPKPFILVKGEPMIRWATASLPFIKHPGRKLGSKMTVPPENLIFIILRDHDREFKIEQKLKEIYSPRIHVIKLPAVTRGAAETAYEARPFVADDEEIIITDSDHHFDGRPLAKLIEKARETVSGIIPVFRARNDGIPKWSYSLLRDDGSTIERTAEKDRALMEAGAYANIGAYYFSQAKHFFDLAKETIDRNDLSGAPGKGEFYVAPLYQKLIERGHTVKAVVIPEVWGLGTPEDLEIFLQQEIKFKNE